MNKASVLDLLKERQRQWASSCSIAFAPNGRVKNLDDNFFVPLYPETLREISDGDGGELGTPEDAGKMYSLGG